MKATEELIESFRSFALERLERGERGRPFGEFAREFRARRNVRDAE